MSGSLRARVRLTTAVVVLAIVVLTLVVVGAPVAWWGTGRAAHVFQAVPDAELARCNDDPSRWRYSTASGLRAWALDEASFAPLDASAPDTPMLMTLRLRAGERQPMVVSLDTVSTVLRRDATCSTVLVNWPIDSSVRRSALLLLAGFALTVLVSSTLLAGWFLMRPILRTVDALDYASRRVGRDDYVSPVVPTELGAVANALDDAHERLQAEQSEMERDKQRLEQHIADVSHDLRSPLSALQLRLERVVQGDQEAARGALSDVAYLSLLTDNLAVTGQLRAGLRAHDGMVDVARIAERVADRYSVLGRPWGRPVLAAVPDAPVHLPAAPVYVEQILNNLVHNAVHHHDGEGTVVVVVEPSPHAVTLEVCDDGPGIPSELPTQRAEAGVGHGLGLSIVRALVDHLGGTLTIQANAPRGLIVRLVIPRRDSVTTVAH